MSAETTIDRIRDRVRSWLKDTLLRRDESTVAESACCAPEHLLTPEESGVRPDRRE